MSNAALTPGLIAAAPHSRSNIDLIGRIYRQQAQLQLKIGFVTGDALALRVEVYARDSGLILGGK